MLGFWGFGQNGKVLTQRAVSVACKILLTCYLYFKLYGEGVWHAICDVYGGWNTKLWRGFGGWDY
jgi:hypothetical protein